MSGEPPTFFCDTMLGRLAKWLRLMGYDAAYEREIGDVEMLRLCRDEGRLLLTRDSGIMQRWYVTRGAVNVLFVEEGDSSAQLESVTGRLSLNAREARCPECNLPLPRLPREEARERVPPYVYETQREFHTCPNCRRIYWKATHWERIERIREDLTT